MKKIIFSRVVCVLLIFMLGLNALESPSFMGGKGDGYAKAASANLLANPGAETGNLSGWAQSSSGQKKWFNAGVSTGGGYPEARTGSWYFVPGDSAKDELYQDVDISSYTSGKFTFSAWMRDYTDSHGDQSSIRMEMLDANGKVLAKKASDIVTKTTKWTNRSITLSVVSSAKRVRVILVSERKSGVDCDSYFDDMSLVYTADTPSSTTQDNSKPQNGGQVVEDKKSESYVEVVSDNGKQTGIYRGPINPSKETVNVPSTVIVNNITIYISIIDSGSFANNKKIKNVSIPQTVTDIRDNSFTSASNLEKVNIGISKASSGEAAFGRDVKIGNNAFSNCSNLKSINMGQDVATVGNQAFNKCKKLTKVVIPADVKRIGAKAFYKCKSLKKVIIKTKRLTMKRVGKNAFKGINKKAVVKVPGKKLKKYKKILKKRGINKKSQKIRRG